MFEAAAGAAGSSALSFAQGYHERNHQYGLNKRTRLNGPSWDVKGLRAAGLNPVLAARGPSSGFAASATGGNAGDISRAMQQTSASNLTAAQTDSAKAIAEINTNKARWESKAYDYLNSPQGSRIFMPLQAAKNSGLKISNPQDAAAVWSAVNLFKDNKASKSKRTEYKESNRHKHDKRYHYSPQKY